MTNFRQRCLLALLITTLAIANVGGATAAAPAPAQTAETVRAALVEAQLTLPNDPAAATTLVATAQAAYATGLANGIAQANPAAQERVAAAFVALDQSVASGDAVLFATARAQAWTSILAGSYAIVETALQTNAGPTAQAWLPVREFRQATRFSRPNVGATLAVNGFVAGTVSTAEALQAVQADVLDTYQARLTEALRDLTTADAKGFALRRAELAALAEGYFLILAPAYLAQRGQPALTAAQAAFAELRQAAVQDPQQLPEKMAQVDAVLNNFRAAPLSPQEQARRAGQVLRFLPLVAIEYGRGVAEGRVTLDLEIQEASTFHAGAYAAFTDLKDLLAARDPEQTAQAETLFETLGTQLADASTHQAVAAPADIKAQTETLVKLLETLMPAEWLQASAQGDFDVIASMLDQMLVAARSGDYALAESSRLDAYAILETGPEAKLIVFAPQLKLQLESLFWNGQEANKGLAYLLKQQAPYAEIKASRLALDEALAEAQAELTKNTAPAAIATNAAIIVFREGLEAVVILASLMSGMKSVEERRYRRPMWLGVILALVVTALTWVLAHGVLQLLARYGEKLEAVVSVIAIGVLLLIMNWFFHKTYWTSWLANFHSQKRRLLGQETGLWLGLVTLGFTSVYREGFEIVLFLQALVLEGGVGVVLLGVLGALAAVVLVGAIVFRLQKNLPYMKILVITGVLIGAVLLQMVGSTTHILQVVGWLPIHVIPGVQLPYWLGTWFGIYPTWEGVLLQAAAATFVVGSYYLSEGMRKHKLSAIPQRPAVKTAAEA